jgi:hypothetical protein
MLTCIINATPIITQKRSYGHCHYQTIKDPTNAMILIAGWCNSEGKILIQKCKKGYIIYACGENQV